MDSQIFDGDLYTEFLERIQWLADGFHGKSRPVSRKINDERNSESGSIRMERNTRCCRIDFFSPPSSPNQAENLS